MSQSGQHDPLSDDPRHQFHELVVAEVVRETADAASFVFDVPAELESLFQYKAGQFFTFQIPWEDFEIKRCYSLSSSPSWNEKPKVTIKRVDDGRMSNWMNDNLSAGDRIQVMPPAGSFILHEHDRPLVLFGGGSGVTPVISLLKCALANTTRKVKLVYANRDLDSVIFRREIAEITSRHADRLNVVHHLDNESGFLTADAIRGHLERWLGADFYICGPTPFMDVVESTLHTAPLEGGDIHIERFVSAVDPDRQHAPLDVAPTDSAIPESVTITLDGQTHEVAYQEGETILAAGARAGLDIPFSCKDGYCSCCMARLKRGQVFMPTHEALSQSEIDDGWVLACQARPTTSECEIEYEE